MQNDHFWRELTPPPGWVTKPSVKIQKWTLTTLLRPFRQLVAKRRVRQS